MTFTLCAAMFSNSYVKWRLRYVMLHFVAGPMKWPMLFINGYDNPTLESTILVRYYKFGYCIPEGYKHSPKTARRDSVTRFWTSVFFTEKVPGRYIRGCLSHHPMRGGGEEYWLRVEKLLIKRLSVSVADPDPGSGIRDLGSGIRCLFDHWIRDPE